jgi:hypothetical protein
MALNEYIEQTPIGENIVEVSIVLNRNDTLSKTEENDGVNNFYHLFDYPSEYTLRIGEIVQVEGGQLFRSDKNIVGLQATNGLELGYIEDDIFNPIATLNPDFSFVPPNINLTEITVVLKTVQSVYQTSLNGEVIKNGTIGLEKLNTEFLQDIELIESELVETQNRLTNTNQRLDLNDSSVNTLNGQITTINNELFKISDLEARISELTVEVMTDIPLLIEEKINKAIEISENRYLELTKKMGFKLKTTPPKDASVVDLDERLGLVTLTTVTVNGFLQKEGENFIAIRKNDGTVIGLDFSPDVFDGKMTVEVENYEFL